MKIEKQDVIDAGADEQRVGEIAVMAADQPRVQTGPAPRTGSHLDHLLAAITYIIEPEMKIEAMRTAIGYMVIELIKLKRSGDFADDPKIKELDEDKDYTADLAPSMDEIARNVRAANPMLDEIVQRDDVKQLRKDEYNRAYKNKLFKELFRFLTMMRNHDLIDFTTEMRLQGQFDPAGASHTEWQGGNYYPRPRGSYYRQ